jgi:predicted ATPase
LSRKRRVHFHEFMLEVHNRMHALRTSAPDYGDLVPLLAHNIASATTLLCFDEFQARGVPPASR